MNKIKFCILTLLSVSLSSCLEPKDGSATIQHDVDVALEFTEADGEKTEVMKTKLSAIWFGRAKLSPWKPSVRLLHLKTEADSIPAGWAAELDFQEAYYSQHYLNFVVADEESQSIFEHYLHKLAHKGAIKTIVVELKKNGAAPFLKAMELRSGEIRHNREDVDYKHENIEVFNRALENLNQD